MKTDLTPLQARVVGVLMEKEVTTPDQYPLSLNALTLGCNQKSSRDPVLALSEFEVQNVLDELRDKNMLFEENRGRTPKYKHRFCNTEFGNLKFTEQEFAVICVLLLRGAQTPGELRTRTNRLAEFKNVDEVEHTLQSLANFNGDKLAMRLEREPGKREARYIHLFCEENRSSQLSAITEAVSANDIAQQSVSKQSLTEAFDRIEQLESKVKELTEQLDELLQ